MTTHPMITQDLHVEVRTGRKVHYEMVADYAEASRVADCVRRAQIATGERGLWRDLWIVRLNGGRPIRMARISMNGRVWLPRPWRQGDVALYDPPMWA